MNKIDRIKKEIEENKKRRKELEKEIAFLETEEQEKLRDIASLYSDFFTEKKNKEFKLYETFPSMENLEIYRNQFYLSFPLYQYGELNAKELAMIIKYLYQFRTQKEFQILTIGAQETIPVDKPQVHFLIGNDNTLKKFQGFNGNFYQDSRVEYLISRNKRQEFVDINLEPVDCVSKNNPMDLSCYVNDHMNDWGINYYSYASSVTKYHRYATMSDTLQIFQNNTSAKLNKTKLRSIRDILSFSLHQNDTFIAKVLISIIFYKRNNNIQELTEEDYNHIFTTLFNEKVNIKAEANSYFPRELKYIEK